MTSTLHESPNHQEKVAIITVLTDSLNSIKRPELDLHRYESYWIFYLDRTRRGGYSIRTHQDLIVLIESLGKNSDRNLETAIQQTKALFPDYGDNDEEARASINLAIGVWLFLKTRWTRLISQDQWQLDESLKSFLCRQFPVTETKLPTSESILHPEFTAYDLNRLCGVRVMWTSYLADHLHFDPAYNTLKIFYHVNFLASESNLLKSEVPSKLVVSLADYDKHDLPERLAQGDPCIFECPVSL